jgi:ribosomal protein S18 acetylase RimI-like enzyme
MKEKLSAIILNVNRNNTEVIRIYEHLGFCKVHEEENDIGNGYFMEDFVLEYTCNYN